MDQVHVRFDEDEHWFVLERGPVMVACNLTSHTQIVPLTQERSTRILLASEAEIIVNAAAVIMPADALVMLGPEAR